MWPGLAGWNHEHRTADLHRTPAGSDVRRPPARGTGLRGTRLRSVLPLRPLARDGHRGPARLDGCVAHAGRPGQGHHDVPARDDDDLGALSCSEGHTTVLQALLRPTFALF